MKNFYRLFFFIYLVPVVLCAEFLYTPKDFGTLAADKTEARSLNEWGWVVGKYIDKDEVSDFLWTPEDGLRIIVAETDEEVYPKINNQGVVVGIIKKPGSWFTSTKIQKYEFNQSNELKLGEWTTRGDGYSITAINDFYTVMCNHTDVFKSTYSFFSGNGKVVTFSKLFPDDQIYPTAINNQSEILVTTRYPGLFGSSLLETNLLSIYDISADRWTRISEDSFYCGCGINDQQLVIARDKNGEEGFYGSVNGGMVSLGDFIPSALNNFGDMVGKKGKDVLLRKSDGTMIDLNEVTNLSESCIDKITDAWAINDKGQILISAQISGKSYPLLLDNSTKP